MKDWDQGMKGRGPRLAVIDRESGEILEADVRARRRKRTISMMYGPNWAAVRLPALEPLALSKDLGGAELRVLIYLLRHLEEGNHIRLRPVDVSVGMGMHNAPRSLRKLKEGGYILDRKPFGWRLNPELGFCGDPTGVVVKRRDGSLIFVGSTDNE